MTSGRPIVVGVDDTAESTLALEWAVAEAQIRRRPLHIVSVYRFTDPIAMTPPPTAPATPSVPPALHEAHRRAVDFARDRLDVDDVTSELDAGSPASALRRAAQSAELLVVGARERPVRHSVSSALAAHARCPVVVVRRPPKVPSSTIVVGFDGSEHAGNALTFAFEEAELRGRTVEAVHYWTPIGPDPGYKEWVQNMGLDLRRQVEEAVAHLKVKYPTVPVSELILEGRPAAGLTERSANADLVVVGSRGHGRLVGTLLGSVSQGLLSHAHCPVVVVKDLR